MMIIIVKLVWKIVKPVVVFTIAILVKETIEYQIENVYVVNFMFLMMILRTVFTIKEIVKTDNIMMKILNNVNLV
jgi:hypothetical protein